MLIKGIFFGGVFNEWKAFWREQHLAYQGTTGKEYFEVVGVDFERMGTFSMAIKEVFKHYDKMPSSIDSLVKFMDSEAFSKTYKNGFPTKLDQKFLHEVKTLFRKELPPIRTTLEPGGLVLYKGNNRQCCDPICR